MKTNKAKMQPRKSKSAKAAPPMPAPAVATIKPPPESHLLPPQQFLIQVTRRVPNVWGIAEKARQAAMAGAGERPPPWVYLPLDLWDTVLAQGAMRPDMDWTEACCICAALGAWRIGQDVYRIDPTLAEELMDTDLDGDLPHEVLRRLPSWGLYVETPNFGVRATETGQATTVLGYFAFLDAVEGRDLERLILIPLVDDPGKGLASAQPLVLELRKGPLADCIVAIGEHRDPEDLVSAKLFAAPLLNLLVYLCSTGAEIGANGKKPGIPQPVKTKQGLRYFPAQKPTVWDCGVRTGAALRSAQAQEPAPEADRGPRTSGHRPPRPHMRRAHWRTKRLGAMKRPDGSHIPAHERDFEVWWQPPTPVMMKDVASEQLPAVIHRVP